MPLVTSHTDDSLKAYMAAQLGATAAVLGWDPDAEEYEEARAAAAYDGALTRTLRAYGVITETEEATNMPRLETLARREIWQGVVDATVGYYDFASAEENLKRAQVHAHAVARVAAADAGLAALAVASGTGGATLGTVALTRPVVGTCSL